MKNSLMRMGKLKMSSSDKDVNWRRILSSKSNDSSHRWSNIIYCSPDWRSHGEMLMESLVIEYLKKNNKPVELPASVLDQVETFSPFIKKWRANFFENLKPQHLPISWSVDTRVCNSDIIAIKKEAELNQPTSYQYY